MSRTVETVTYALVFALGAIPLFLIVDAWRRRSEGWIRWLQMAVYLIMMLGAAAAGYRAVANFLHPGS